MMVELGSTVGAFDARTRFFELLEQIEAGQEVTITRHGIPVARLVPAKTASAITVAEATPQGKRPTRAPMPNLHFNRGRAAMPAGELVG